MPFSNSFSDEFGKEFAQRNLKIGSVIRVFVKDTKPPKQKRLVLVGQSYDKLLFATVFINSEINPNVFPTQELRDLNIELTAKGRPYLDHDSHADCSSIYKQDAALLFNIIAQDPKKLLGQLSDNDLHAIRAKIKSARTITSAVKKTFGLYL